MFDVSFAELLIIGVVGLLVIGPERLPGAIRTASVWLGRLRRGFNDIKREVQQELHNDEVMQELRRTSQQVKKQTDDLRKGLTGDDGAVTGDRHSGSETGQAPATSGASDQTSQQQDATDKTTP